MATNKKTNPEQGKKSTAKTDATYNRDTKDLRNSPTSSQGHASSTGSVGVGGVMREEDKQGTRESERAGTE